MFIKNNQIANQLYVPYTDNIRNLSQSARRLATGEKLPTAGDGGGELGFAERIAQKHRGASKLIEGVQNTMGFVNTQDEVLSQAMDVVQRMSELATSSLDTSKNTADRVALDNEFQALENEFSQLTTRRYNGISLFVRSLSVRVTVNVGDTTVLSTITLAKVTFTNMTLSQLASASAALLSLTGRLASINALRSRAGNNVNQLNRTLDFMRSHRANLMEGENAVRNIDLAVETGNFTKQQVILAASQSVLSQSNGITQSALQFLG